MTRLDAAKRASHVAAVEKIARLIAGGVSTIHIEGIANLGSSTRVPVKADIPLADAADAARKVGKMIATHKFKALNHHSIQEIESWDDDDEAAAAAIAQRIMQRQSIVGHGDDAQLLAGATLTLLRKPQLYDSAQSLLNDALDDSFRPDPIWRALKADHAFAPHVFRRPKSNVKAAAARSKRPGGKSSRKKGKR